jgi:hypothetical protein
MPTRVESGVVQGIQEIKPKGLAARLGMHRYTGFTQDMKVGTNFLGFKVQRPVGRAVEHRSVSRGSAEQAQIAMQVRHRNRGSIGNILR